MTNKHAFATGRYVNGKKTMVLPDGTTVSMKDFVERKKEVAVPKKEVVEKKERLTSVWATIAPEDVALQLTKEKKASWIDKVREVRGLFK